MVTFVMAKCWTTGVRLPAETWISVFATTFKSIAGTHTTSYPVYINCFLSGVKTAEA